MTSAANGALQSAPHFTAHFTPHFTLYSRSYCHLCEDLQAALRNCMARSSRAYTLDVVDVDANPDLVARFDELVPVLYAGRGGDAVELCHYFLDEPALLRYLAARGGNPAEAEAVSS